MFVTSMLEVLAITHYFGARPLVLWSLWFLRTRCAGGAGSASVVFELLKSTYLPFSSRAGKAVRRFMERALF